MLIGKQKILSELSKKVKQIFFLLALACFGTPELPAMGKVKPIYKYPKPKTVQKWDQHHLVQPVLSGAADKDDGMKCICCMHEKPSKLSKRSQTQKSRLKKKAG